MNDRLAHNLRCIEEGLALDGLAPERRFDTGMQLYLHIDKGLVSIALFSADEGEWIVLFSSHPVRVPIERRLAVAEALTRINYQQVVGNFDLDFSDGEVRYRIGHATDQVELTPGLVQRLVGYVAYVWRRFHDTVMSVAYGGRSPEDAVRELFEATPPAPAGGNAAGGSGPVDVDAILKELGLTGPIRPETPPQRTPFANAYVVPGTRLVAGEYPGTRDERSTREKVRGLLDAGVQTVIDLTRAGELEPYAGLLAAEAAERGTTVRHVRMPIEDMSTCSPEEMRAVLDEIDACLNRGEAVYVHCWGGVGRTGTVVGCWLVRHGQRGADALAEVQRLFETMTPAKVARHPEGSPQTARQRRMVVEWGTVDRIPNAR